MTLWGNDGEKDENEIIKKRDLDVVLFLKEKY